MAQFSRPDNDDTIGSWIDEASGTTDIYTGIDEDLASQSDTDLVRSENDPSTSEYIAGLGLVTDPEGNVDHVVRYRYQKGETGGGQPGVINLIVQLREGTTVRASNTHNGIATGFVDGTFTLSSGEADAITDYSNLNIRFQADKSSGARTSWAEISRAEFEVPAAGIAPLDAEPGAFAIAGTNADFIIKMPADTVAYAIASPVEANLEYHRRFKPIEVGAFVVAGMIAILTPTLNPESGAYAITGTDANFTIKMPAATDSYAIAGTDVDLFISVKLTVDAGAYVIDDPIEVNLEKHSKLTPVDPGVYALAGQIAVLTPTLNAGSGPYSVVGTDADFTVTIPANNGAFSIAGTDANLELHSKITPVDSGAYIIAGQIAILTPTLNAGVGAYSITGTDADFTVTIPPALGTYVISGTVANLELHTEIVPVVGTYLIDGKDVTLTLSAGGGPTPIDAESGSFVIAGQDASLELHTEVVPVAGIYNIAGTIANLEYNRILPLDPASVLLAGQAATVRVIIVAITSTYAIAGTDVDLDHIKTMSADSGTFVITGQLLLDREELELSSVVSDQVDLKSIITGQTTLDLDSHISDFVTDAGVNSNPVNRLTADGGVILLSGQPAAVIAKLNALPGAYALAGQDATLTLNTGYSTTAQGVFDLMDTDPSIAVKDLTAAFIDSQASAEGGSGNWELGDQFLCFRMGSEPNGLVDWFGNQNALAVGSPMFNAFDGFILTGTEYINSQRALLAGLPTLNNVVTGIWNVGVNPTGMGVAARTANNTKHQMNSTGTGINVALNNASSSSYAENDFATNSLYLLHRDQNTIFKMFKNGVSQGNLSFVSVSAAAISEYIGARNLSGVADTFFTGTLGCFWRGKAVGFDHSNFYSNLNTMMTGLAALG